MSISAYWQQPSFDLSSIDASSGITFSRTGLGPYVSGGGDFNGDGFDDLVFSAEGVTHTGEVVVVFGHADGFPESVDLSTLDGTNGFVMSGIDTHDGLNPASFIGDFNGDGLDDLVLGAAAADQPGATTAGEAYIVYGQSSVSSGSLDLAGLDGTNGFTFRGIASHQHGDRVGSFVADAGDVNNDGFDDVLITAAYGDNLGGAAYLLYGTADAIAGGNLRTDEVDGTNGYVINTGSGFTGIGRTASLGDVNGDGIDDVLIGATADSPRWCCSGWICICCLRRFVFCSSRIRSLCAKWCQWLFHQ